MDSVYGGKVVVVVVIPLSIWTCGIYYLFTIYAIIMSQWGGFTTTVVIRKYTQFVSNWVFCNASEHRTIQNAAAHYAVLVKKH